MSGTTPKLARPEPLTTAQEACIRRALRRLPRLTGEPIVYFRAPNLRDRSGPIHGGAFLRERRILFDCTQSEFPRIFVHEVFHFVWLRAGNPKRRAFEDLIAEELRAAARGELGWAAESRKLRLRPEDLQQRTRRWREYCCESFCDTAAWLYGGLASHDEFTLATRWRKRRRAWFERQLRGRELPV